MSIEVADRVGPEQSSGEEERSSGHPKLTLEARSIVPGPALWRNIPKGLRADLTPQSHFLPDVAVPFFVADVALPLPQSQGPSQGCLVPLTSSTGLGAGNLNAQISL
jgi:hypothetical protein